MEKKVAFVLGIETSCDETGCAVFDSQKNKILSNELFSQVKLHANYGGIVPEIASRSQLEKIDIVTKRALLEAQCTLDDIETIAVTTGPGLAGSLLIGICFAKSIAWCKGKKIVSVNHHEGHVYSTFFNADGHASNDIPFPHICLLASGGHTSIYLVKNFLDYELIARTTDDAAGEALDKTAKAIGLPYPGGPEIEQLANQVSFEDFFAYPRGKSNGKKSNTEIFFSFSGLKTAVLYHLVKQGAYNLSTGMIKSKMTTELQQQVSSSLLNCIADIFSNNVSTAFKKFPEAKALTFCGGVACNKFIRSKLETMCANNNKNFFCPPPQFCTDNGGMIALVGSHKASQGLFSDHTIDVQL